MSLFKWAVRKETLDDHRGFRIEFRSFPLAWLVAGLKLAGLRLLPYNNSWKFENRVSKCDLKLKSTARSREDETRNGQRNGQRNANRNPEWWRDFIQLVRMETLKCFDISRYKFKMRFWFYLNFKLTKISPPFRISICISLIILSLIFSGTGCTDRKLTESGTLTCD